MFSSSRKPYTAVTQQIERLTGPEFEPDDPTGIFELIEVIQIQDSGPTEVARAIRKKLKYGTAHRQLRALTILDYLIQNVNPRSQRAITDEALLERLRLLPRDDMSDPEVREKSNALFRQWAHQYKSTTGMQSIANLYKELPKRPPRSAAQSRIVKETEQQAQRDADPFHADEDDDPSPSPAQQSLQQQAQMQNQRRKSSLGGLGGFSRSGAGPSSPSSSRRPTLVDQIPSPSTSSSLAPTLSSLISSKDKKKKKHKSSSSRKTFDLQREAPQITQCIASSNIASTNLLNSLKFVNREAGELPSTNREVIGRFETCKTLRRQVLRYIQLVESEQWIGSLLQANDDLVKGLMAWEVLEKGMEDDSDSEVEDALAAIHGSSISNPSAGLLAGGPNADSRNRGMSAADDQLRGLNLNATPPAKPARPPAPPTEYESESEDDEVEEDEDNPFGDHAAIGRT